MKTCKDCRFYTFHSKNEALVDVGTCRRYPPQVIEENKAGCSIVSAQGWCGEYRGTRFWE